MAMFTHTTSESDWIHSDRWIWM